MSQPNDSLAAICAEQARAARIRQAHEQLYALAETYLKDVLATLGQRRYSPLLHTDLTKAMDVIELIGKTLEKS